MKPTTIYKTVVQSQTVPDYIFPHIFSTVLWLLSNSLTLLDSTDKWLPCSLQKADWHII